MWRVRSSSKFTKRQSNSRHSLASINVALARSSRMRKKEHQARDWNTLRSVLITNEKYRSVPKSGVRVNEMRSFRELFAQQSAPAIFTAANEHGVRKSARNTKGRWKNREIGRKRERGQKKIKNRMEIRLGRYQDNKSRHPAPSCLIAPRQGAIKRDTESAKIVFTGRASVVNGRFCLILCVEKRP